MKESYVVPPWWHLSWMQVLFLMFFLLFFGGSIYAAVDNQRKNGYIPIQVTVTGNRIFVEEVSRNKRSETRLTYKPMIFYQYVVDGVPYEGGRVWPADDTTDQVTANEVVARYKVGNTYTAYYNQSDPGSSYLERSTSLQPYMGMVASIVMFLAPVIMLGVQKRRDALINISTSPNVSPKLKRQAAETEKRYKRRIAVVLAGILLVFSLCFVLAALSPARPSPGSPSNSVAMLRGMFVIFAIGMAGAAALMLRNSK